jgi:hypothetical protein
MEDPKTRGILVLILNIIIPGVGGLIYASGVKDDADKAKKARTNAIIQLVLYVGGVVLSVCTFGLTTLASLGAWIWALIEGIKYFKELSSQAAPSA